jgi:flagellar basal-body rod protein FlgF
VQSGSGRSGNDHGAANAGSRPQRPTPFISALAYASVENSAIADLVSAKRVEAATPLIANAEQSYTIFSTSPFWLRTCNAGIRSMDQISVLAAAGMQSRMQSLDLVANNLANSSTGGYKSDGEFFTLFTSETAGGEDAAGTSSVPMIQRQWTDFAQGLLEPTNNPLDFGLSGKGFFVVQGPSGPLYTRNGNFRFSNTGALITSEGYPLLQQNGQPFKVNTSQPLEVSRNGDVGQNGKTLGTIKLAEFENPAGLSKYGANYFSNTTGEEPVDATGAQIYQGKIEASNVSASHGAVRIVGLSRQFEMMQKAISISNDMGKKAIEEVAKV